MKIKESDRKYVEEKAHILCINTYIEATHEKKKQQRQEIEKVRNNEDKESFITNIEIYIGEREENKLMFIYIWSFTTVFKNL